MLTLEPCHISSQVLTILQEVFPAVKAAEMALKHRPLWWEGWQTLGRAQLNLGEVDLVSKTGSTLQMKTNKCVLAYRSCRTAFEFRAANKCNY